MADAGIWDTFLLGVAFRHVICGFYLLFLPVRLPFEIRKFPPDPPVRGFPRVWKLPLLWLPSWDGSPSLALLSFFLSFIFCPASFWRQWAAFLDAWCTLLETRRDQKLFCGVCSALKCSFDEFIGEKVVSPSYSSTVLASTPRTKIFKVTNKGKNVKIRKWKMIKFTCYKKRWNRYIQIYHQWQSAYICLSNIKLRLIYSTLMIGEGYGNPLQYSCLENPMNKGDLQAMVHGVGKSRTRLRTHTDTHTHSHDNSPSQSNSLFHI